MAAQTHEKNEWLSLLLKSLALPRGKRLDPKQIAIQQHICDSLQAWQLKIGKYQDRVAYFKAHTLNLKLGFDFATPSVWCNNQ